MILLLLRSKQSKSCQPLWKMLLIVMCITLVKSIFWWVLHRDWQVSTNFLDLFAFSGPAPERINGRLAMIGFVAAMVVEFSSGEDVFAQISNGGIPWFLGTSIVLSLASLIPLFKGISVESKSEGVMTSDAEMWNGRFAMLGLVALAITEYVKGGTLI